MDSYIERITKPIIDFKKELFPLLENIDDSNIHELLKSLEISVSNGWVGEASEISDSLLNSDIVQNNPSVLINVHIERMKKYQYFELHNLANQTSLKVLELLENNSKSIKKSTFDLWKFTAIAQLGWIERDILKLEEIIERSKSVCTQSKGENKKIMKAFITGLSGRKYLMENSIKTGEKYFNNSINQLKKLKYYRAVAHLKVYFAENMFEFSSIKDSYQLALKILNENEINKFKSHLVLRVYSLLIRSNLEDNEKKQNHILSLQILMYAMGLGQSQEIYPFIKSAFDLIPDNMKIDFFKINFKSWLDQTINSMSWIEYESLVVRFYRDRDYSFVEKLPDNFPVFDIYATGEYDGTILVTLIQTKHWKTKVKKGDVPDGVCFEQAFTDLKKRYKINSINFIKYFILSGITKGADEKIRSNVKNCINSDVKVDMCSGNDEVINFYLNNPSKLISLLVELNG